jgi:hypothetical protein
MNENTEIELIMRGNPFSGLLNEPWFLDLIYIIPELKTLLVNNILIGICLSPVVIFTFAIETKYVHEIKIASTKLAELGYKVNTKAQNP